MENTKNNKKNNTLNVKSGYDNNTHNDCHELYYLDDKCIINESGINESSINKNMSDKCTSKEYSENTYIRNKYIPNIQDSQNMFNPHKLLTQKGTTIKYASTLLCGVVIKSMENSNLNCSYEHCLCLDLSSGIIYILNNHKCDDIIDKPKIPFHYLDIVNNIFYIVYTGIHQVKTLTDEYNLSKNDKLIINGTRNIWILGCNNTWQLECNIQGEHGIQESSHGDPDIICPKEPIDKIVYDSQDYHNRIDSPQSVGESHGIIGERKNCCKCLNIYNFKNIKFPSKSHFTKYRLSDNNNPNPTHHTNINKYWKEFNQNGYNKIGAKNESTVYLTSNLKHDIQYSQYLIRIFPKELSKLICKIKGSISLKTNNNDILPDLVIYMWNNFDEKWDVIRKTKCNNELIYNKFDTSSINEDARDYIHNLHGLYILVTLNLPINENYMIGSISIYLDFVEFDISFGDGLIGSKCSPDLKIIINKNYNK
jgi:hypothetical protein